MYSSELCVIICIVRCLSIFINHQRNEDTSLICFQLINCFVLVGICLCTMAKPDIKLIIQRNFFFTSFLIRLQNLRVRGDETLPDLLNLSNYCHKANLVIKPKKRTAIMWYNHWIDPKSGWMGKRIEQSLHGGCDVIKGEKWIGNIWLTAPYADSVDKPSMYFTENDYKMAEELYGSN